MSDFTTMRNIITKFPKVNEEGEDCYKIHDFKNGHAICFATDDSYCWAQLYFNKKGEFVGFSPMDL